MRRALLALAAASLVLSTPAAAKAPARSFSRQGISFRYPATWAASPTSWAWSSEADYSNVAYLSPKPMRKP